MLFWQLSLLKRHSHVKSLQRQIQGESMRYVEQRETIEQYKYKNSSIH